METAVTQYCNIGRELAFVTARLAAVTTLDGKLLKVKIEKTEVRDFTRSPNTNGPAAPLKKHESE